MPESQDRIQISDLLSECEAVKEQFTANEFEMYSQIKAQFQKEPGGAFDDKICLEVMLRNIAIRKDLSLDKNQATRVIEIDRR